MMSFLNTLCPDDPETATHPALLLDRLTEKNQTGGQSRAKPSDEAVKDALLSFIRTADT